MVLLVPYQTICQAASPPPPILDFGGIFICTDMAKCKTSWTIRCLKKLLFSDIYTKTRFKALQKQWMALLVTYQSSFQAESGPQIRCFSGFLAMTNQMIMVQYDT